MMYLDMANSEEIMIYWFMNTNKYNSEWDRSIERVRSFLGKEELVKKQCKYILAYAGFEAVDDKIHFLSAG